MKKKNERQTNWSQVELRRKNKNAISGIKRYYWEILKFWFVAKWIYQGPERITEKNSIQIGIAYCKVDQSE